VLHLLWALATAASASPGITRDTGLVDTATRAGAAGTASAPPLALPPVVTRPPAAPPVVEYGPRIAAPLAPMGPALFLADSGRQRPRAFEYSDAYYTRLEIHKIASYATIPLFAAEYVLGSKLYSNPPGSRSTLDAHRYVALGVAGLFAVNTVTGAWNLWDSRHDPNGRTRRYLHAGLMFLADCGFVATGATAPGRRRILYGGQAVNLSTHRAIAIASMSTALASYTMMLLWKK